ncbi:MAG: PilZ domain-containing protein [Deltaproteobacteria bacterium]|nr:PilZ domain-containing protein [Deltaproteobacteria bacterium]MBW2071382.1 PilZ domain-containing protein [Deltaproteobacteria bacterium]
MRKLFINQSDTGYSSCSKCGKLNKVNVKNHNKTKIVEIKCYCGNKYSVEVEKRQCYRKNVNIVGTFQRIYPDNSVIGRVNIEDISRAGLGFTTVTRNTLDIDNIILLDFKLDDIHKSHITTAAIVKIVKGNYVGVEFKQLSEHNKKIIGFYLLDSHPPFQQPTSEAHPCESLPGGSSPEVIWQPFGVSPASTDAVELAGKLSSWDVPSVLRILCSQKKSGILSLQQGRKRRAICLKRGSIIAATGNEHLRLGHILLHKKMISPKQLQQALEKARESGKRLGEILLDSGYVSQSVLQKLLNYQIKKTAEELASWNQGNFRFKQCQVELKTFALSNKGKLANKKKVQSVLKSAKRREYSRVSVSWPGSMHTSQGSYQIEVKNISLTGALIHCQELPNPDEIVQLAIEIPEHHYGLLVEAEMVRLEICPEPSQENLIYAVGVRFRNLAEEDVNFLTNTVLH